MLKVLPLESNIIWTGRHAQ